MFPLSYSCLFLLSLFIRLPAIQEVALFRGPSLFIDIKFHELYLGYLLPTVWQVIFFDDIVPNIKATSRILV